MPKVLKVPVDALVSASKVYAQSKVDAANLNHDTVLSPTEAKRLAADLHDNYDASGFKLPSGSVRTKDLVNEFVTLMEAFAHQAADGDGMVDTGDADKFPKPLRDNLVDYIHAQQHTQVSTGNYSARDVTPKARIDEQLRAYPQTRISYKDAFAKAVKELATSENGLRYFFGEGNEDEPLAGRKLTMAVKKALSEATLELVPMDQQIPTDETADQYWIFQLNSDAVGDNGVWAVVDRKTGETGTETFN